MAPVIADICNASLCEGCIPALLKTAAVCPISKKSPPKIIETDIRPISLTCQVAKLLEGFTLTRIYKPILNDLDKKQFALAGKSTEQALVYLLHIALEALDRGNCSVRFFFADFRKGFDLIDHGILLQKLCNYNIHDCLNKQTLKVFLVSEIPGELYVSVHEAYKALRSVKTKKSAGPDGIPNSVLKEFAFELAPVIADICNASLCEGCIPALLKTVAVCPIPKTSPPKIIETDIRPISLTCQVAKLLEGFTLARIYKPILSDLDKKQFALAGKSTEQALVYLLHIALEALDKGICSVRFFFADFRKGFDLIDHGILLQKLCNYNIHNCLTRWVASFLQGRSQSLALITFAHPQKFCVMGYLKVPN